MASVHPRADRFIEFGAALRRAREDKGISQFALAEALNTSGIDRKYQSVQGWERGDNPPAPEIVFALEQCLGVVPGRLSRILGYLPLDAAPALSVPDALAADHRLTDDARVAILGAYQAATGRQA